MKNITLILQDLDAVVEAPSRKLALWHKVEASTITRNSNNLLFCISSV